MTVLIAAAMATPAAAESLRESLGRNEVRILSRPFAPPLGARVGEIHLAERLERLGYARVHRRPTAPGEFFWGHEVFWIFERGADAPAGWRLAPPGGRIVGYLTGPDAAPSTDGRDRVTLEPELLGTSFEEQRAQAGWVALEDLPESAWRALLAIEDTRFFDHHGVDGRAVARALLANLRSGGVVQGGSTITQQLIKLRDLSPKRSLGRKASEAVRALALEAEHSKEEILEAYLNLVYYGHADGLALYGIDAAARAYYSTAPQRLDLRQSAALAALVQAPNRLSPLRHPEALRERYGRVLDRLADLGWTPVPVAREAKRRGPPAIRSGTMEGEPAPHFRAWLGELLGDRGGWIESGLDAGMQAAAEEAVRAGLARLRASRPALRDRPLQGALVALDATTGDVVAYVGGDPATPGEFDRARRGRRQPGSTVKPLVLLEAFETCGSRAPLFASRRVVDRPLVVPLDDGDWRPQNADRRFRGTVTVRQAIVESLNVPMVRIARHCGFEATAERLRRAGLDLPEEVPPAFVLGAVEVSPLALATAYTPFVNRGRVSRPRAVRRARLPAGGRRILATGGRRRVASPAAAHLVLDLLRREDGPSGSFGKTGTSSDTRDAWYAGGSGRLVAVVWVGLDDGGPLGAGGAAAAEPIWRHFVAAAAPMLGVAEPPRPARLVEHWVDPVSGLRLGRRRAGAESFWFKTGARPPRRRLWRRESPLAPVE